MRSFCAAAFGKRWRGVIEKLSSPLQDDAHNCGVFVVANAVHWMRSGAVPEAYEVTARTRLLLAHTWLLGETMSVDRLR
jgi:Ulp1 family protease